MSVFYSTLRRVNSMIQMTCSLIVIWNGLLKGKCRQNGSYVALTLFTIDDKKGKLTYVCNSTYIIIIAQIVTIS